MYLKDSMCTCNFVQYSMCVYLSVCVCVSLCVCGSKAKSTQWHNEMLASTIHSKGKCLSRYRSQRKTYFSVALTKGNMLYMYSFIYIHLYIRKIRVLIESTVQKDVKMHYIFMCLLLSLSLYLSLSVLSNLWNAASSIPCNISKEKRYAQHAAANKICKM